MRLIELCRRAGITSRTAIYAVDQNLITVQETTRGSGHILTVSDTEAARIVAATGIAQRYHVPLLNVLRWQRDGRIEQETAGRLVLRDSVTT